VSRRPDPADVTGSLAVPDRGGQVAHQDRLTGRARVASTGVASTGAASIGAASIGVASTGVDSTGVDSTGAARAGAGYADVAQGAQQA
jgi:hypothetical protein